MTIINHRRPNVNYRNVTMPAAPLSVLVGAESSVVLAQNNSRVGAIFVNLSPDTNVYLAFGHSAILNGGITLLPSLGWQMGDFSFCVDEVCAISDGSALISIQEFTL